MDIKTVKDEVEEWVSDPGTMVGSISTYEWMITTHWVTKEIIAHVLMDR